MCVGVCITRRGMVYFGASIHIFVTLILLIGSSIRAFHLTTYEQREDARKEILGGVIIAVYFFILLILGCLIFRATEQKNAKLLGWTGGTFITLETFAFVFNLIILSPMGGAYDEYGFRNFGFRMNLLYMVVSSLFLLCMMAYCATIIMYISKLKEDGDQSVVERGGEEEDEEDVEASTTGSSRTASTTFFGKRSQMMDNNKQGGGGGGGGFNILEVVKEAKRQQQLKEQKELREKQKGGGGGKEVKGQNKGVKVAVGLPQTKPRSRPITPQIRPHTPQLQEKVLKEEKDVEKPIMTVAQGTQSDPPPHMNRPPSRQSSSQPNPRPQREKEHRATEPQQLPRPNIPPEFQSTCPVLPPKPLTKCQEQQTQTPLPHPPHPHHLFPPFNIPPPPNLLPQYTQQSQTLPPRRVQHLQENRPYFLQDYSQRGILSAPSFASITASIVPTRFRNPSLGLRTTKSGTLLRYEDSPPPPPLRGRGQQVSSSCSSFDPMMMNPMENNLWEQPRGGQQALKQNYNNVNYNALRRGTHRGDYGMEV